MTAPRASRLYTDFRKFDATQWHWPHFSAQELSCKCRTYCRGEYYHDPGFLDALEALRVRMGRALIITSGHRCPLHNAWVGGAPLSQHRLGLAVDISIHGWPQEACKALLIEARALRFTGFGLGTGFLHLDRRRLKPPRIRPAIWDYNNGGIRRWMSYLE